MYMVCLAYGVCSKTQGSWTPPHTALHHRNDSVGHGLNARATALMAPTIDSARPAQQVHMLELDVEALMCEIHSCHLCAGHRPVLQPSLPAPGVQFRHTRGHTPSHPLRPPPHPTAAEAAAATGGEAALTEFGTERAAGAA